MAKTPSWGATSSEIIRAFSDVEKPFLLFFDLGALTAKQKNKQELSEDNGMCLMGACL